MAASTGPVVAAGVITAANGVIGNSQPWTYSIKIGVATAIAAGLLALAEHASAPLAIGIAWIALITSLLVTPKTGRSAVDNALSLTGLGGST
jgi:hypothetical protein